MKQKTSEQIIAEEINQIITACKKISQLSPHTVIPEEHCWNPKPNKMDPVYKNKLINTANFLDQALLLLDRAYNTTPLNDDHKLIEDLSDIRTDINSQILYYKALINGSN